MNGFYVSLVFFGILLVAISLFCVLLDKRKVFQFSKSFDEKKRELVEIINDADQMIGEMNKFSDYIVSQIDQKNEELSNSLKSAGLKVEELNTRLSSLCSEAGTAMITKRGSAVEAMASMQSATVEKALEEVSVESDAAPIAVNGSAADSVAKSSMKPRKSPARKNEKVIPINNKYSEVLRLSEEGMQELEIARKLNMGKGEVELILGLKK
jgi:hypothetical protein